MTKYGNQLEKDTAYLKQMIEKVCKNEMEYDTAVYELIKYSKNTSCVISELFKEYGKNGLESMVYCEVFEMDELKEIMDDDEFLQFNNIYEMNYH